MVISSGEKGKIISHHFHFVDVGVPLRSSLSTFFYSIIGYYTFIHVGYTQSKETLEKNQHEEIKVFITSGRIFLSSFNSFKGESCNRCRDNSTNDEITKKNWNVFSWYRLRRNKIPSFIVRIWQWGIELMNFNDSYPIRRWNMYLIKSMNYVWILVCSWNRCKWRSVAGRRNIGIERISCLWYSDSRVRLRVISWYGLK